MSKPRESCYVSTARRGPDGRYLWVGGGKTFTGRECVQHALDWASDRMAEGLEATVNHLGTRCQACAGSGIGERRFTPTSSWFAMGVWGKTERFPCAVCHGSGRIGARGPLATWDVSLT